MLITIKILEKMFPRYQYGKIKNEEKEEKEKDDDDDDDDEDDDEIFEEQVL